MRRLNPEKVLFRTAELKTDSRNLHREGKDSLGDMKDIELQPTIFTLLCLNNDVELITRLIPYANEESIAKGVQFTTTIGASGVLDVLLSGQKIEINNINGLLEHAIFSGFLNVSKLLYRQMGVHLEDVVNHTLFKRAKLLSNYLSYDTGEVIKFYEQIGVREIDNRPSVQPKDNENLLSIQKSNGNCIHVVGIDDTSPQLKELLDNVITCSRPDNILLPLCPERSDVLSHCKLMIIILITLNKVF